MGSSRAWQPAAVSRLCFALATLACMVDSQVAEGDWVMVAGFDAELAVLKRWFRKPGEEGWGCGVGVGVGWGKAHARRRQAHDGHALLALWCLYRPACAARPAPDLRALGTKPSRLAPHPTTLPTHPHPIPWTPPCSLFGHGCLPGRVHGGGAPLGPAPLGHPAVLGPVRGGGRPGQPGACCGGCCGRRPPRRRRPARPALVCAADRWGCRRWWHWAGRGSCNDARPSLCARRLPSPASEYERLRQLAPLAIPLPAPPRTPD